MRPGRLTIRVAVVIAGVMALSGILLSLAYKICFPGQGPVRLGLSINDSRAFPGYTLIAPTKSTNTYLIDMQGRVVRQWQSDCYPGLNAHLLENGHLLRSGTLPRQSDFNDPGAGRRVQEFSWEGEVVWDFPFTGKKQFPHHDLVPLPNGNVLLIVDEPRKTAQEAIAAGRRPELMRGKYFYLDGLIEIKPTGKTTGEVVWEWHLWDHLVQESDESKANFGKIAEHLELIDLNYSHQDTIGALAATKGGLDKLRAIGYVGQGIQAGQASTNITSNWSHLNSVAYNPDLDQIMVTSLTFGEFWIIDHSSTTSQAANHRGGRSGRGGDLLYRWGNPRAYGAGTQAQQRLFGPHDAHWIPSGLPGAGHVLVFNNGKDRPDGSYSSVEEVELPVNSGGGYARLAGAAFGPEQPLWSYHSPNKADFYSMLLSGAQRLPNGNTLICSGCNGTLLEVTPEREIVWKYVNPTPGTYLLSVTSPADLGPPGGGSLFRAYRYGGDYPGLAGKDLTPGQTIEELQAHEPVRRPSP
jgi:hypothetical protein